MTPPWIPREPAFWRYHLGALVFVLGMTVGSSLIYGTLDRLLLASTLVWPLAYTAAVLGFRGLALRHCWERRSMRSMVPVVLAYSVPAGLAMIALTNATVLPFFWAEIVASQGPGFAAAPFLLRSIVGNGLQSQLFVAAWAFVYLSALNAERAREAELMNLQLGHHLKEAQLSQLANQLNPHFLFNALNNIRFMLHEDAARADRQLVSLSDILRYTLGSSRLDKVPLGPELDAVHDYVALMSGQLEQRLRFELDLQPALQRALIPPMLLAMLVENGVKHGLERLPRGGVLSLKLWADDARLHVRVSNDRATGTTALPETSMGLGLANITERLRLLYGEQAVLRTADTRTRFTVDLSLPLEHAS